MLAFFNSARLECIDKQCSAQLLFKNGSNIIKLYEGGNLIDKIDLPQGFKTVDNNVQTVDGLIYFNEKGIITTPCSFSYKDRENKIHLFTIEVGTAYVDVKD